jgi:hypothetical protein
MNIRTVLMFGILLSVVACREGEVTGVELQPRFSVELSPEEAEEYEMAQAILNIEGTGADIWDWTTVSYWGEATFYWFTLAGPLWPQIRNDAIISRTVDGTTGAPISIPGQYELTLGYRFDYKNNLGGTVPDCVDTFGKMTLSTTTWAEWHYMAVKGLLPIRKGPVDDGDFDECKPSDPPPNGGGGFDPGEGDCEMCQQWFWYEDGEPVDEWWECWPIDPMYCEELT